MIHETKIVSKQSVSNGVIAVTLRCCDDSTTDSVATIHVTPDTDVTAWVAAERARVEGEHQAILDAHAALEQLS